MPLTIREAKDQILIFINEAEKCLHLDCGYSAVTTLFSVILAVSEALMGKLSVRKRYSEDTLINYFVDLMDDKEWFISKEPNNLVDAEIKKYLYDLRNGLSHQLSLPQEIGLISTAADLDRLTRLDVLYYISVEGFIASVKSTVEKIIKDDELSTREMDPNHESFPLGSPREIGSRLVVRCLNGLTTSGSAVESRIISSE